MGFDGSTYFLVFIGWFAILAVGQYILGRALGASDNWRAFIPGVSLLHLRDMTGSDSAVSVIGVWATAATIISIFMIWHMMTMYVAGGLWLAGGMVGIMSNGSSVLENIGTEWQTVMTWSTLVLHSVYAIMMYDLLKRLGYCRLFAVIPLQIMPLLMVVVSSIYIAKKQNNSRIDTQNTPKNIQSSDTTMV